MTPTDIVYIANNNGVDVIYIDNYSNYEPIRKLLLCNSFDFTLVYDCWACVWVVATVCNIL